MGMGMYRAAKPGLERLGASLPLEQHVQLRRRRRCLRRFRRLRLLLLLASLYDNLLSQLDLWT